MTALPDALEVRKAGEQVLPILLKRWSPRAMSGESVSAEDLQTIFDAARWAPSSYNEQEWRYLYAGRDSEYWNTFFELLVEGNQSWCKNASHLIAVVAKQNFTLDGRPNPVASLDTGASMQNLLLQTAALGLVGHPMAGFDWSGAAERLNLPEGFAIQAMIAIGKPGDPNDLPDGLAEAEKITDRKPIDEIAREGLFTFEG